MRDFTQPATDGGYTLDIYKMDNSFNMIINTLPLYSQELEFQTTSKGGGATQNVRFKSDKAKWANSNTGSNLPVDPIWIINAGATIDTVNHLNNPTPAIRVIIDKNGSINLYGIRKTGGILEPLEVFLPNETNQPAVQLDSVVWSTDPTLPNNITVSQNVIGATQMVGFGYGLNIKSCQTCTIEKAGFFEDENNDGYAQIGETITYTFKVKNLGDLDIRDVEIVDPLLGTTITLGADHLPEQPGVNLEGDDNNNGVLNRNETWIYTVSYEVTEDDIYLTEGVYNRAKVKGVTQVTESILKIDVDSSDPDAYTPGSPGWDPERPFHTYVPLEADGIMITNPMIYQKAN